VQKRNNEESPAAREVEILAGHADARKSLQKSAHWPGLSNRSRNRAGMGHTDGVLLGIVGLLYEAHRLDVPWCKGARVYPGCERVGLMPAAAA